jgi:hypothetical protein
MTWITELIFCELIHRIVVANVNVKIVAPAGNVVDVLAAAKDPKTRYLVGCSQIEAPPRLQVILSENTTARSVSIPSYVHIIVHGAL